MAEMDTQYLKHQYVYVPWIEGKSTTDAGQALALYIAREHKARLTVVTARAGNAPTHPAFKKLPVVTERSGSVQDGGVVLAWCPTYKVMDRVHHLGSSVVVLVEWPTARFDSWAKLVGAYNVVTNEVMKSGLSEANMKSLEGVIWEGYNGWHDDIARRSTTARLAELAAAGRYDRELVLAYARWKKGEYSTTNLVKILDQFEMSGSK